MTSQNIIKTKFFLVGVVFFRPEKVHSPSYHLENRCYEENRRALGMQRVFLTLLLSRITTIVLHRCQNGFVAKWGLFRAELIFLAISFWISEVVFTTEEMLIIRWNVTCGCSVLQLCFDYCQCFHISSQVESFFFDNWDASYTISRLKRKRCSFSQDSNYQKYKIKDCRMVFAKKINIYESERLLHFMVSTVR